MKIAITSDLYYPMTNGVAVFAHNLAKGLAKNFKLKSVFQQIYSLVIDYQRM